MCDLCSCLEKGFLLLNLFGLGGEIFVVWVVGGLVSRQHFADTGHSGLVDWTSFLPYLYASFSSLCTPPIFTCMCLVVFLTAAAAIVNLPLLVTTFPYSATMPVCQPSSHCFLLLQHLPHPSYLLSTNTLLPTPCLPSYMTTAFLC